MSTKRRKLDANTALAVNHILRVLLCALFTVGTTLMLVINALPSLRQGIRNWGSRAEVTVVLRVRSEIMREGHGSAVAHEVYLAANDYATFIISVDSGTDRFALALPYFSTVLLALTFIALLWTIFIRFLVKKLDKWHLGIGMIITGAISAIIILLSEALSYHAKVRVAEDLSAQGFTTVFPSDVCFQPSLFALGICAAAVTVGITTLCLPRGK